MKLKLKLKLKRSKNGLWYDRLEGNDILVHHIFGIQLTESRKVRRKLFVMGYFLKFNFSMRVPLFLGKLFDTVRWDQKPTREVYNQRQMNFYKEQKRKRENEVAGLKRRIEKLKKQTNCGHALNQLNQRNEMVEYLKFSGRDYV